MAQLFKKKKSYKTQKKMLVKLGYDEKKYNKTKLQLYHGDANKVIEDYQKYKIIPKQLNSAHQRATNDSPKGAITQTQTMTKGTTAQSFYDYGNDSASSARDSRDDSDDLSKTYMNHMPNGGYTIHGPNINQTTKVISKNKRKRKSKLRFKHTLKRKSCSLPKLSRCDANHAQNLSFPKDEESKELREIQNELQKMKRKYTQQIQRTNEMRTNYEKQIEIISKMTYQNKLKQTKAKSAEKNVILWQWKGDNNVWNSYGNQTMARIESMIGWDRITFQCTDNNQTYKILKRTPNSGTQTNVQTNVVRQIRRIGTQTCVSNANDNDLFEYPPFWDKTDMKQSAEDYTKCKYLSMNAFEAQFAMNMFWETVNKSDYKIIEVVGVQNKYLWDRYCNEKQLLMKNVGNKAAINERYLFHGTKHETMKTIARQGFRKEFTTTAVYGEGTYFAKNAKYSIDYCEENDGIYKMFLCQVICGEMYKGERSMKLQDWPQKMTNGLIYDSLVDSTYNPKIFVMHGDARAYPMYIILFKRTNLRFM